MIALGWARLARRIATFIAAVAGLGGCSADAELYGACVDDRDCESEICLKFDGYCSAPCQVINYTGLPHEEFLQRCLSDAWRQAEPEGQVRGELCGAGCCSLYDQRETDSFLHGFCRPHSPNDPP